jgi:mono/diheme cytochrome c family protein
MKILAAALIVTATLIAADQATLDRGKQEESRACIACHSLRIVHSQRLSRAAWTRELDKMTGWGTKITDRDALLEYLLANFGDDKPLPKPDMSK